MRLNKANNLKRENHRDDVPTEFAWHHPAARDPRESAFPEIASDPNALIAGRHIRPQIIVAEDDDELRRLIADSLLAEGFRVIEVCDGLQLRDRLHHSRRSAGEDAADLVITDIRMPGLSGLDALAPVNPDDSSPPVILMTAFGDGDVLDRAARLGAAACFDKPFDIDDLCACAREILSPTACHAGSTRPDDSTPMDE